MTIHTLLFKNLRVLHSPSNRQLHHWTIWSAYDINQSNVLILDSHFFLNKDFVLLNKFLDLEIFKFEFRFDRPETSHHYGGVPLLDSLGNKLSNYYFRKILYNNCLYPIIYFKHSISDGYDIKEKKVINVFDKYNELLKILNECKIKMHKKIKNVLVKSLKNTEIVLEECSTSEQLLNSIYDMTTHELQYISSATYLNLSFVVDTINLMSFEKYI